MILPATPVDRLSILFLAPCLLSSGGLLSYSGTTFADPTRLGVVRGPSSSSTCICPPATSALFVAIFGAVVDCQLTFARETDASGTDAMRQLFLRSLSNCQRNLRGACDLPPFSGSIGT